ncbi:alpha/beta hydrolase [Actinoplanes sp. SE50]|uniref:alpha/beta fold hydrolase n=1 Tax=unclassified Actinoplanes TaxID=2626549 RepID=UPI00023EC288|nr:MULTISPECIES: alpha/beta hydrolase [unclassified Actinoplanes]AEV84101.1 Lipase 1 [Actinoplanes sp. SE50/110]ATO82493.1 alpha/beta hydrolase [Actinoplanes sp. SE50]SLL99900.1 alpha/beta hydrolase [Actinoplanes sp. SE50/110]
MTEILLDDRGTGKPYLLLHGGGGVATMAGLAGRLAARPGTRVLLPTHPGFAGTVQPDGLRSVGDLARAYVALLDERDLTDVTVVGNSFGGWLAAEIALLRSPRVSGAVLINAIGIEVAGHPVADVGAMTPAELAAHAWHDPSRAPKPPAAGGTGPSPDILALVAYTGPVMNDPTLLDRLRTLDLPVHVIWGASDRVVDVAHAEAFAAALPQSTLTVLPGSGHLPQLETPEELVAALLGD